MSSSTIKIILFLLLSTCCHAQFNQWVWINGDTITLPTSYGTKGIAASGNFPGGRYESCDWTDKDGKFWLYGGTFSTLRADLWKYDPATNMWTWVHGDNTPSPPSVYGSKGVSSPANTPGPRGGATPTWVDTSGNLWLFGGSGLTGQMNDLWKYSITTNEWTWMHGANTSSQAGIYGTRGIPDPANSPGARYETTCTWTDKNNNLWLFGGTGYDNNGNPGSLNDLWKYNIGTNEWTWVSGNKIQGQASVYGTKGLEAAGNKPGGRNIYSNWIDSQGNFWMFGGSEGGSKKNDLWKFNPVNKRWTWMSGDSTVNQPGQYGNSCEPSVNNYPPMTYENREEWIDDCDNLWLFGGGFTMNNKFNDLWRYSIKNNTWTWVKGDASFSPKSVYGTKGTPSIANRPGGKYGGVSWKDTSGFWIYGGITVAPLPNTASSVLWKYIPDKPTAAFTLSSSSTCSGAPLAVNFTSASVPNCNEIKSYFWEFDDPTSGTSDTSSLENPSHTFNNFGTYDVKLVVTSCTGSKDSISQTITVTQTPVITVSANNASICPGELVSLSANGAGSYSWIPSGGLSSSTGAAINASPTTSTTYSVIGTESGLCPDTATVDITVLSLPPLSISGTNSICSGDSTVLTVTGANSYTWIPASGLSSPTDSIVTVNIINTSTYDLIGLGGNGCNDTISVTVTVNDIPIANTSPNDSICSGEATTITASGGADFLWNTGETTSQINVIPVATMTYSVIVANGPCSDTGFVNINVSPMPTVSVSGINAICSGDSTVLTASGAGSYTWAPASGLSSPTDSIVTVNIINTSTYDLIGLGGNGCNDTISVTITVNDIPIAFAGPDDTICAGETAFLTASGGTDFLWNTGEATTQIIPSPTLTSIYSLTVSNGPCDDTDSVTITVVETPTVVAGQDTIIVYGSNVVLSASGSGSYLWYPANNLSCSICSNPVASPKETTMYYVTITDAYGCESTDSVLVAVKSECGEIYVPNAFSPNKDGQNEVLYIYGACIESFTFTIYNRWGEKVFETNNPDTGWDGNYKGKLLTTDIFYYYIFAHLSNGEERTRTGNINLIR